MIRKRWTLPATALAFLALATIAPADEKKIEVEDLPKAVLKAVKAKFPEAKIRGAAKEVEDGETMYEVELTVDGKNVDVLVEPEGDIEAIEKEIEIEDLPRAVLKAARAKFPKGKIAKVEEITEEDDKVTYELVIAVQGKEDVEVVMAPNGKIIEADDEEDDKDEKKAKKSDKDDDDEKGEKKKAKKSDKDDDDEKGEKKKAKKADKDDDDEKGEKKKAKKADKDDDEKKSKD